MLFLQICSRLLELTWLCQKYQIQKLYQEFELVFIGDTFIVKLTIQEMENLQLDLLLAEIKNAILMVEGYCDFLLKDKLVEAIDVGQNAVRGICKQVETLLHNAEGRKCSVPSSYLQKSYMS